MTERPEQVLVVDAANVVGARPDGWWRDRARSAERLVDGLAAARRVDPGLSSRRIVVVLEGEAAAAAPPEHPGLEIVRAPADGDATIVEMVSARRGEDVLVVTSDRELRRRVEANGARVRGAGWLRDLLDGVGSGPR